MVLATHPLLRRTSAPFGAWYISVASLTLGCDSPTPANQPGSTRDDSTDSANAPVEPSPSQPEAPLDAGGTPGETSEEGQSGRSSTSFPSPSSAASVSTDASLGTERTVRGRVIDFWGHVVPGVQLLVDNREATTDDAGAFTIEGVPATYDVSLAVRILGEVTETYGWHFVGLTRRDPTLQIYKGLSQHTTPLTIHTSGLDANARWRGQLALGGQHGQRAYSLASQVDTIAGWRGPDTHTSPVQILVWSASEENTAYPESFLYSETRALELTQEVPIAIDVNVPASAEPLSSFRVALTTQDAPGSSHLAASYLRFAAGPSIQLTQIPRLSDASEPHVTLAPRLPDTSITLAAFSGNGAPDMEFSVTYANGVTDEEPAVLPFPGVAALLGPEDQAIGVDSTTPFSWTDTGRAYVVAFEDLDFYQTVFVVTTDETAHVPELTKLGIYYPHDGTYRWTVETHGAVQSVDELCDSAGYLDPFSGDFDNPLGPRQGSGQFSRSAARSFQFD